MARLSDATNLRVRPVTGENWADFDRLFQSRGSPHYCWCTPHRFPGSGKMSDAEKRQGMKDLVETATPIGVLASDGSTPVGWCSIAPRETYVQLQRSRTMRRATPPATATWVVLCFFVTRPYRGRNVTAALLRGAVAYAREHGAAIVEGYPFDTAGVSSTHRGHSSVFKAARFEQHDKRWSLRLPRR
jgi:GNAT superfamily N-acetyltransferase